MPSPSLLPTSLQVILPCCSVST